MSNLRERVSDSFVSFIARRPLLALLLGLVLLGALYTGLPKLRPNFTHTAYFRADDPQLLALEAFERKFGNDDAVVIAVHSPSGVFDLSTATLLRELTERMWKVPEVIRVDSLANFQWVHAVGDEIEIEPLFPDDAPLSEVRLAERKQVALEHELLPGYLVSEDAKTAMVYARIKPGLDRPANTELVTAKTQRVIESMRGGDHSFHLTGGPIMNDAFRSVSSEDLSVLVPALLAMVVVLLLSTLRSVAGVVLPMIIIVTTVLGTFAFAGHLGVELSPVTLALPQVLIAVCVADAVHLMAGFFRARRAGLPRRAAAKYTLHKNLVATLLTSVTTALGFASFATANLRPIEGFGVVAALGTVLAWVVTYLVAGALMVLWPGKDGDGAQSAALSGDELMHASPRSRAYVDFIARHRVAVVAGFALLTVASAVLGARNVVTSNPYEYFARDVPVRQAQDFLLGHMAGVAGFEVVVDSGREDGVKDPAFLRKVERFERDALATPGIEKSVSIVDILRQMNRALHGGAAADYRLPETAPGVAQQLLLYTMGLPQGMDVNDRISVRSDALRVTLVSDITDSSLAVKTAERLERRAQELGLRAHVTGKTMLYQNMNGHVVWSFLSSLLLALVLIGSVMLLSFKSLRLGLISMIPNVVPLVVGGAALYLVRGSLDIGTVMVASVCLGIAVDNTIHILTNFNQHVAKGDSPVTALAKLLSHTGPAMMSTTLILIFGFLTLAFGDFVPNVYFGLLTATVLAAGMVADFVLLPALLLMLVAPAGQESSARVPAAATSAP